METPLVSGLHCVAPWHLTEVTWLFGLACHTQLPQEGVRGGGEGAAQPPALPTMEFVSLRAVSPQLPVRTQLPVPPAGQREGCPQGLGCAAASMAMRLPPLILGVFLEQPG